MAHRLRQLLADARKVRGATLRQVEDKTGVSNAYLSQIESGHVAEPSPHILHKLATFYGLDYGGLLEAAGYSSPKGGGVSAEPGIHFMGQKLTDDEAKAVAVFLRTHREVNGGTKKR